MSRKSSEGFSEGRDAQSDFVDCRGNRKRPTENMTISRSFP